MHRVLASPSVVTRARANTETARSFVTTPHDSTAHAQTASAVNSAIQTSTSVSQVHANMMAHAWMGLMASRANACKASRVNCVKLT